MTEPTERDRRIADKCATLLLDQGSRMTASERFEHLIVVIANSRAAGREEGRREERARWEAWVERLKTNSDRVPGLIGLMWRFPPPVGKGAAQTVLPTHQVSETVSDLSDDTQGVPSPNPPENDQG